MKYFSKIILISTFAFALPSQAKPDNWDRYVQIMDGFYNLDKQEFKTVSCNIEVPVTKNQIAQLHERFKSMKDQIELTENLKDFRMTYTKNAGLSFKRPTLDIKIISENGMTDVAKVKSGIEMIDHGFKQQVDGTVTQLNSFFDNFDPRRKPLYTIKAITGDKTAYTANYERGGSDVTETYSDNQRKVQQISRNGDKVSAVENYKSVDNQKLLLNDVRFVVDQAMSRIEMDTTISYEKIQSILFPTHFSSHFNQFIQTIRQEAQIDIDLKDCAISY
jgi:hypothetical protein